MEEQNILETETGEKEVTTLKPAKVEIVKVEIEEVRKDDKKIGDKLVCNVKHPDKEETIQISSVKFEQKGKLQSSGLWINLDEDKKIRKGSALAMLMGWLQITKPKLLEGQSVNTVEDDKGYLCFKAY